jgi:hypothetical protein
VAAQVVESLRRCRAGIFAGPDRAAYLETRSTVVLGTVWRFFQFVACCILSDWRILFSILANPVVITLNLREQAESDRAAILQCLRVVRTTAVQGRLQNPQTTAFPLAAGCATSVETAAGVSASVAEHVCPSNRDNK